MATPLQLFRIRTHPQPVKALARAYGIPVIPMQHADHEGRRMLSGDPDASPGPLAGAINPFTRTIYMPLAKDYHSALFGHAVLLHEIMHVLCALPFHGKDGLNVPEENLVMPVERAFARALLPARKVAQVIDWQEATETCVMSTLDMLDDYETADYWQRGLLAARISGLLDEQNVPTLRWPNWSRLGLKRYRSVVAC